MDNRRTNIYAISSFLYLYASLISDPILWYFVTIDKNMYSMGLNV